MRPYRSGDVDALRAEADDYRVARWMTRRFPHPYTRNDAERWIAQAVSDTQERYFVIEAGGVLAGGAGVERCEEERRGTALFGYWLGVKYWGCGIASEAARMLSDHALRAGRLWRLEASVFAPNVASIRVLEKSGFRLEGRLRGAYLDREENVCDALLFARLADPPTTAARPA